MEYAWPSRVSFVRGLVPHLLTAPRRSAANTHEFDRSIQFGPPAALNPEIRGETLNGKKENYCGYQ
jgi:hypothetical protein